MINATFQISRPTTPLSSTTPTYYNPTFDDACNRAVDHVLEVIDSQGFITEYPYDHDKFRNDIFDAIKNAIQGNVNYSK